MNNGGIWGVGYLGTLLYQQLSYKSKTILKKFITFLKQPYASHFIHHNKNLGSLALHSGSVSTLDNFNSMPGTPDQNQFSILSSIPITRKYNKLNFTLDIYPEIYPKINFHMKDILEYFLKFTTEESFFVCFSFFFLFLFFF